LDGLSFSSASKKDKNEEVLEEEMTKEGEESQQFQEFRAYEEEESEQKTMEKKVIDLKKNADSEAFLPHRKRF